MSTNRILETPAGVSPAGFYFVVFRHKWKIIVLTLLGLAAATALYFARQPLYQSDAELYIRYVTDNRPLNPLDNNSRSTSLIDPSQNGANVLNSEIQILGSLDIAKQVATNFGAEKLLAKAGGGQDLDEAALLIRGGLELKPIKDSADIYVTLQYPDIDLVRPVLAELIKDYQEKHIQVHRAIGIPDDKLADQILQLRMQIAQTDDELRMIKTNAGIISVEEAKKSYEDELTRIRRELLQTKALLAEHQTSLSELAGTTNSDQEKKFHALVGMDTTATSGTSSVTSLPKEAAEAEQVAHLPLRIKELQAQFDEIQLEAARLNDAEAKISELERTKSQLEEYIKSYQTLQSQSQMDAALGSGRANNIQVIQEPSPPYKDFKKFYQPLGILAFSGLLLGLAWAFLIEFYQNHFRSRSIHLSIRFR